MERSLAESSRNEHGYLKTNLMALLLRALLMMKVMLMFYLLKFLDVSNLLGPYEYESHYKVKFTDRLGKEVRVRIYERFKYNRKGKYLCMFSLVLPKVVKH